MASKSDQEEICRKAYEENQEEERKKRITVLANWRILRRSSVRFGCTATLCLWAAFGKWMGTASAIAASLLTIAIVRYIDERIGVNKLRDNRYGIQYAERKLIYGDRTKFGVTLFALGTRGDVEPMLAVAKSLKGIYRENISLLMCGPKDFGVLAEAYGIQFRTCGLDKIQSNPEWSEANSQGEMIATVAEQCSQHHESILDQSWKACLVKDGNPEEHHTDAIIAGKFAIQIAQIFAEALNVPFHPFMFAPDHMTGEHPPFGEDAPNFLFPILNRAWNYMRFISVMGSSLVVAQKLSLLEKQRFFREERMNLPPMSHKHVARWKQNTSINAYSSHLFTRPTDWEAHCAVVGFCFGEPEGLSNELSPQVQQFCTSGPFKPICISFGSMECAVSKPRKAGETNLLLLCINAIEKISPHIKCVVICQHPDSSIIEKTRASPNNFMVIPSAPYAKLFPLVSCVVHHGGAGTTSRALLHGIPSVIIPVLEWYDQRGWGQAVSRRFAGILLEKRSVNEERVRSAVSLVIENPIYSKCAEELSALLLEENGAVKVASLLGDEWGLQIPHVNS